MELTQENVRKARRKIVGWDLNAPEFEGFGGKVGLCQDAAVMPDGDLLLAFSAGYWHMSMATPYDVPEDNLARWQTNGFPRDHKAPRGGRAMLIRSSDQGATWTRPMTVVDTELANGAQGLCTLHDGTVLLVTAEQASWYGYAQAPEGHPPFNTRNGVLRSTDDGRTWSDVAWLDAPYRLYQRCFSKVVELSDGTLLLPTYCKETPDGRLLGAVHQSSDGGRTWRVLSTIEREDGGDIDEPSIVELPDGRLMMITRLDGAVLHSSDRGATWRLGDTFFGNLKSPRLVKLSDGAIVCVCTSNGHLSISWTVDAGRSWQVTGDGKALTLDGDFYGYPGVCTLDDETLLVVYYDAAHKQCRTGVWGLKIQLDAARENARLIGSDASIDAPATQRGAGDDLDVDAM